MNTNINEDRQIEIFRAMAQAWHDQDWEKCASLFAEDGVLQSVMLPPIVGRQAIYDRIHKLGGDHKKVTLKIERIGVMGGALFVQRVDEVVINGKRGECPVVGVVEFKGDKIARWLDYYDRATLARAANYTPEQEHH